jgi:sugar/nucleoside kinase (ribokinase family)
MPEVVIVNPFMHPDVIVFLRDDQEIVPNRVTVGHSHQMRLGAGAYTARAFMAHKWDVQIVDAIGDDIFGEFTFRESLSSGFGMDHVVRYQGSHMFLISVADQQSEGGTMISSCPSDWQRPAAEVQLGISGAPSARVYYIWSWFWSYANKNLQSFSTHDAMSAISSKSDLTVLDPNWKPPGAPPEDEIASLVAALPLVDVLKLNRRDAAMVLGNKDPRTTILELLELGASLVVLTLGEQGCALGGIGLNDVQFVPSTAQNTRNTTGAGDVFGGAFVASYSDQGDPLRAAHDATEEVRKFLAGNMPLVSSEG